MTKRTKIDTVAAAHATPGKDFESHSKKTSIAIPTAKFAVPVGGGGKPQAKPKRVTLDEIATREGMPAAEAPATVPAKK